MNSIFIQTYLLALSALAAAAQGTTQTTVFPYGAAASPGSGGDPSFMGPTTREMVFSSGYLQQAWSQPVIITSVAFRADGSSFSTTIPRIDLRLSTTDVTPQTMTGVWFYDGGPDSKRYVFDNMTISAVGGGNVNPFSIRLDLSEPFYYDPNSGNLSLYLETSGAGQFSGGGGIDAVAIYPINAASIGVAGTGLLAPFGGGLVTQFTWAAIPEPSPACLITAIGLLVLVYSRKIR